MLENARKPYFEHKYQHQQQEAICKLLIAPRKRHCVVLYLRPGGKTIKGRVKIFKIVRTTFAFISIPALSEFSTVLMYSISPFLEALQNALLG